MRPIIIYRKRRPRKGWNGKSRWPFIVITTHRDGKPRPPEKVQRTKSHEKIHHVQWEADYVILYPFKYYKFHRWYGYRHNPYEIEAYRHAHDPDYWKTRDKHGWKKYHAPEYQGDKYRG
jgi:hypothetical protein